MPVDSKTWADRIITDIGRVGDAARKARARPINAGDADRIMLAFIAGLDSKNPIAIRLARKIADVNSIYSKRAA